MWILNFDRLLNLFNFHCSIKLSNCLLNLFNFLCSIKLSKRLLKLNQFAKKRDHCIYGERKEVATPQPQRKSDKGSHPGRRKQNTKHLRPIDLRLQHFRSLQVELCSPRPSPRPLARSDLQTLRLQGQTHLLAVSQHQSAIDEEGAVSTSPQASGLSWLYCLLPQALLTLPKGPTPTDPLPAPAARDSMLGLPLR